MRGAIFEPVHFKNGLSTFYQLIAIAPKLSVSSSTVVGDDVFNPMPEYDKCLSTELGDNPKQTVVHYKCPLGHLIGGNLISEPYIDSSAELEDFDIFASKQYYGVKLNLLRPEPLYFCSPALREMVLTEKLTGFDFQIARLD